MRPDRVCIHSEERNCDESPIPSKAQDRIAQLKRGMVLVRVTLVKVDIWMVSEASICPSCSARRHKQLGFTEVPFPAQLRVQATTVERQKAKDDSHFISESTTSFKSVGGLMMDGYQIMFVRVR